MILVYITCKDKQEALKISKHLLDKKLAACTNMFPISSMYWWDNKITGDKEYAVLAKTMAKNFDKIKQEVKSIHSYKIPCIILWNINANKEYKEWVVENIL